MEAAGLGVAGAGAGAGAAAAAGSKAREVFGGIPQGGGGDAST